MKLWNKQSNLRNKACIPVHVGIIMDGNGRWAKKRGLPRYAGHSVGAKTFRTIARYCRDIGVKYLTVYAFSTENWKRPKQEVDTIMNLLRDYLKDVSNYKEDNIKTQFIGDRSVLDEDIVRLMDECELASKDYDAMTLNIAINYGGRAEIVHAVQDILNKVMQGDLKVDSINEEVLSSYLYTNGQPDPDLIIRPSGEYRLSNFLTWQSAYSELVFMNVLWPDFKPKHIDLALEEFANRNRRYGAV